MGFVGEILVSRRSGRILDGHLRVAEAIRTGQAVVPVGWVDCRSDEDEAAILATHDPIGAMATADREKLAQLAEKAQVQADPLKLMLAGLSAQPAAAPPLTARTDLPRSQTDGAGTGTGPPGGGGHLGRVPDLIYPVVVECATEEDAEVLLENLAAEGHSGYLLDASPSSAPRDDVWKE